MSQVVERPLDATAANTATAAANTAVVLTFAAVTSKRHILKTLAVSYSAAPTGGRVTVKDGATTVYDADITAGGLTNVPLPDGGLRGSTNTALEITLAAGGAAVVGKVNAYKDTRPN